MSEESADSDEQEPEALPITVSEAARILGCTRAKVHLLCTKKLLKFKERGNGTKCFKRSDVMALAETGDFDEAAEPAIVQLNALQNELTNMSLDHVRKVFNPVTEAWSKVGTMYQTVIDSLITRNEKLEATHLDMIKQRESYLNDQHSRDIAAADAEAKRKHAEELLKPLKDNLPVLLDQVGESFGGKKKTDMATLVAKLAASGKLQALLESDVLLDEEERSLLHSLVKDFLPKDEPVVVDTNVPPQ